MTVRTLIFVQCLLVFALLEELIAHLAHVFRDLERKFRFLSHVFAIDGVLVFRVVLVHVAVA